MAPFVPGKGPAATPDDTPETRRRTSRRTALIIIAVLGAVVVLSIVWIGVRGSLAVSALQRTQGTIAEIRADPDPAALPGQFQAIVDDTTSARSMTDDIVWRAAEILPVAGPNMTAVRELAAASGRIGEEIVAPVADAMPQVEGAFAPKDGRLDVAALTTAASAVSSAGQALPSIQAQVDAVDTSSTIGQLAEAKTKLEDELFEISTPLAQAAGIADVLPGMLGADGPRNYLLLFGNNAEVRPLFGNPASLAIVTVDDGRISLGAQASSRDFPVDGNPPAELPDSARAAYDSGFARYITDIPTRPDFPTTARLAQGFWEQRFGQKVDGVLTIDPIVLGYLLEGAAPIALPGDQQLTSADAAKLLLSDVYTLFPTRKQEGRPEDADQNAFFAAATKSTFDALLGGQVRPEAVARGVVRGVEEGRVLFWSTRDDEESSIAATPLGGVLPADNSAETVVGVYLSNLSANKMDFFTSLAVDAEAACSPDGSGIYEVTYTIDSGLDQATASSLPFYQAGGWWGTSQYRTDSYAVGPVGARYLDSNVAEAGNDTRLVSTVDDLGRPVVRMTSYYPPGAEIRVTVRFQLDEAGGPLTVRSTPLVEPAVVTVKDGCA